MDAEEKLQEIVFNVAKCELCPLHKNRTNTVPGFGNSHAKILFIGEAPGKTEDLNGLPFCGASGKLLDKLLLSINLSRDEVFITNIVKCRPPENRNPSPDECATCTNAYLNKQIETIKPTIIITLGRFALNHFLPNAKISECHGQIIKLPNLTLIPLFHPAVAFHSKSKKEILTNDFKQIKNFINII